MSFKELYQSKKMDADQALNLIRSGDRVVVGHACAEPSYLLDVLTEKAEQYENVEIVHMVAMGTAGYCAPGMEKHFRHKKEEVTSPPAFSLKFQSFLKTAASPWTQH